MDEPINIRDELDVFDPSELQNWDSDCWTCITCLCFPCNNLFCDVVDELSSVWRLRIFSKFYKRVYSDVSSFAGEGAT